MQRHFKHHMGWLRLVGSLKLQVSLENIGLFYRALLQKRPIILRSLLIIATPYILRGGQVASNASSCKSIFAKEPLSIGLFCGNWPIKTRHLTHLYHIIRIKVSHNRAFNPAWQRVAVCCRVLQCVALCCSVLQHAAAYCNMLTRVAACCSVLQLAAVCCSVKIIRLQRVSYI